MCKLFANMFSNYGIIWLNSGIKILFATYPRIRVMYAVPGFIDECS